MVGHDRPWRILFVGGGVIGSIYAARFVQAGHQVTVLDRGQRLRDIREHGLVLQPALGGPRVVVSVATVEALEADGDDAELSGHVTSNGACEPMRWSIQDDYQGAHETVQRERGVGHSPGSRRLQNAEAKACNTAPMD